MSFDIRLRAERAEFTGSATVIFDKTLAEGGCPVKRMVQACLRVRFRFPVREALLFQSYLVLWRIEYSRCSVRINKRSPTSAGDASAISSSSFMCNNWNFSPVAITNVWPSSLRQNSLPL